MISVTSAEFQKHFGHFRRVALNDPITISVHGQDTLVVLSAIEYERLRGIEAERSKPVPSKAAKSVPTFRTSTPAGAAPATPDRAPPVSRAEGHTELADLERIAGAGSPAIRFHDVLDPESDPK